MPLMEYDAEVIRGWPNDGSLDRVETCKSTYTAPAIGDWVEKQSDGTVDLVGGTKTSKVGMVAGFAASTSDAKDKVVVLWSNFIVKVKSTKYKAGAYAPGSGVTAGGGGNSGKLDIDAGSDPVIGFVLNVQAAVAGSEDANIVVLVK
jgi:hypothetical protein